MSTDRTYVMSVSTDRKYVMSVSMDRVRHRDASARRTSRQDVACNAACLGTAWEAKRELAAEAPECLIVHELRERIAAAVLRHFVQDVLDPACKCAAPLDVVRSGHARIPVISLLRR